MGGATSKHHRPAPHLSPETHRKAIVRVPLHLTLKAVVIIQRRVRISIARKKLKRLKDEKRRQELAAQDYLLNIKSKVEESKVPVKKGNMQKIDRQPDDKEGQFINSSTLLINQLVGFVIKSKSTDTGKKIFINVCHHNVIESMSTTKPRIWLSDEDDGAPANSSMVKEVIVFDVVLPTKDFDSNFRNKHGVGIVAVNETLKNKLAIEVISLICAVDYETVPLPDGIVADDLNVSLSYKFPKIKKGYIGEYSPLLFNLKTGELHYAETMLSSKLPPASIRSWVTMSSESVTKDITGRAAQLGSFAAQSFRTKNLSGDSNDEDMPALKLGKQQSYEVKSKKSVAITDKQDKRGRGLGMRSSAASSSAMMGDELNLSDSDLESEHVEYFKRLNELQIGTMTYAVLRAGVLYIYDSLQSNPNHAPYAENELARVFLGNQIVSIATDVTNQLFYIHLSIKNAAPDHRDFSTYLDRYTKYVKENLITFQFTTFSELATWKLLLTAHQTYATRKQELFVADQIYEREGQAGEEDVSPHNISNSKLKQRGDSFDSVANSASVSSVTFNNIGMGVLDEEKLYAGWILKRSYSANQNGSTDTKYFLRLQQGILMLLVDERDSEDRAVQVVVLVQCYVQRTTRVVASMAYEEHVVSICKHGEDAETAFDSLLELVYYSTTEDSDDVDTLVAALEYHMVLASNYVHFYTALHIPPVYGKNLLLAHKDVKSLTVSLKILPSEDLNSDDDDSDEEEKLRIAKTTIACFRVRTADPYIGYSYTNADAFIFPNAPVVDADMSGGAHNNASASTTAATVTGSRRASNFGPATSNPSSTVSTYFQRTYREYDILFMDQTLFIFTGLCCVTRLMMKDTSYRHLSVIAKRKLKTSKVANINVIDAEHEIHSVVWQIKLINADKCYCFQLNSYKEYLQWVDFLDCNRVNKVPIAKKAKKPKLAKSSSARGNKLSRQESKRSETEEGEGKGGEDDEDRSDSEEEKGGSDDDGEGKEGEEGQDEAMAGDGPESAAKADDVQRAEATTGGAATGKSRISVVDMFRASIGADALLAGVSPASLAEPIPVEITALTIDNNASKKYSRILRPQERIVAIGFVLKFEKLQSGGGGTVPNTKRNMLLTTVPRLLYLDPIGTIVHGNLEFKKDVRTEIKLVSSTEFEINVGGTVHRFATTVDIPEKSAKYWVDRLKLSINKKD